MKNIRYTLISDGSSDRMLMPILDWLLRLHCPNHAIEPQWADLKRIPRPPKSLSERIKLATELYECDLLFITLARKPQPFKAGDEGSPERSGG